MWYTVYNVHVCRVKSRKQQIWLNTVKKLKKLFCIACLMYKTDLTRICVTETEPPGRYLGHHTACKHSPEQ